MLLTRLLTGSDGEARQTEERGPSSVFVRVRHAVDAAVGTGNEQDAVRSSVRRTQPRVASRIAQGPLWEQHPRERDFPSSVVPDSAPSRALNGGASSPPPALPAATRLPQSSDVGAARSCDAFMPTSLSALRYSAPAIPALRNASTLFCP